MSVRLFALSVLLMAGGFSGAKAAPVSATGDAGDPEAVVCRPLTGRSQFSTEVCSHDHVWLERALNGKDLAADGKSPLDKPTVDNPRGDGDPDAVTCRTPKFVWFGPLTRVCETNRYWAGLIKKIQVVEENGEVRTSTRPRERGCGGVCDSLRGEGGWSPSSNSFESQSFGGGNTPTFPGNAGPASP